MNEVAVRLPAMHAPALDAAGPDRELVSVNDGLGPEGLGEVQERHERAALVVVAEQSLDPDAGDPPRHHLIGLFPSWAIR